MAGQVTTLVGRERECGVIRSALAAARDGRGSALLLAGEPGMGKTALLAEAERAADGFASVWAHGVQGQSPGNAGLLELLTPLRRHLAAVPAGQAAALGSALGWDSGFAAADPFLLSAATLSLLTAAAEVRPVLLLVDDLQWIDEPSAAAVMFAAARLNRDRVAVLASAHPGSDFAGLAQLRLPALPLGAARELLPGMAGPVAERLVADCGGNPLALQECAEALTAAQRAGAAPLPTVLPVGDHLLAAFAAQLADLPQDVALAVQLVAVEPAATIGAITRAGGSVDEAVRRRLLQTDGDRVRLRHPLLRAAVLGSTEPARLRLAHQRMADAFPARRVWHLAHSTTAIDDGLADALDHAAGQHRDRQGYAAASIVLERAAHLTGEPHRAAARLAAATHEAFVAGDGSRVRRLADEVLDSTADAHLRARVQFDLGVLEQYSGSIVIAADLLADSAVTDDPKLRVRSLVERAHCLFRLGDVPGIVACAEGIESVADPADPEQRMLTSFVVGLARTLSGDPAAGRARLLEVIAAASTRPLKDDPGTLLPLALAAGFTGQAAAAMAVGEPLLALARARGAVGVLVPVLALTAAGRAVLGDHAGAFADAGEAVELGELLGYTADVAVALEMLAWQSAARGLHAEADSALLRARTLLQRAGTMPVAAHHALTAAFCALCRGDMPEVVRILEARIAADGGIGSVGEPLGVAPDLVEAYLAMGRARDAAALAAQFAAATDPQAAAPIRALVARCAALTAESPAEAEDAYSRALAAHEQGPDAFERVRTHLLYGIRLRKEGQRVRARDILGRAARDFESMDLTLFADRAAAELAATGATARSRRASAAEPLTSQETRVALLVSRGMTNREVAAALFLSPKTVEHHVGSVFRKRGFRTRAELAWAFAQDR